MRFFEEITAITEQERLTGSSFCVLAKKEILAAALPGGFPGRHRDFLQGCWQPLKMSSAQNLRLVDFGPVLGNIKVL